MSSFSFGDVMGKVGGGKEQAGYEKPKPKPKLKIVAKKKEAPKPKKEAPKKKKLVCYVKKKNDGANYTTCLVAQKKGKAKAPAKPKAPKITITENPKDNVIPVSRTLSSVPDSYKPTVKKIKIGKEPAKPKKEPESFDRWDEEVKELYKKTKGKLPKTFEGEILYYHDFFNTDGSTTLSVRKTKNYDIPTYVRKADGYMVSKTRWRDYSWDD